LISPIHKELQETCGHEEPSAWIGVTGVPKPTPLEAFKFNLEDARLLIQTARGALGALD
jgi:hypothetical protein